MTLNTFVEIEAMMALINDADVRRTESHLTAIEKGEVSLGIVHDVDAHRMWAVAEKFQRAEAEALLKLKFEVESADDQASLGAEAARAHAMESLARDIFWIMAKDAIGQDAWNANGVGVRAGWMLVTATSPPSPRSVLKALFGVLPPGG